MPAMRSAERANVHLSRLVRLWGAVEGTLKRFCSGQIGYILDDAARVRNGGKPQNSFCEAGVRSSCTQDVYYTPTQCCDNVRDVIRHEEDLTGRHERLRGWHPPFGVGLPPDCKRGQNWKGGQMLGRGSGARRSLCSIRTMAILIGIICLVLPRVSGQGGFTPFFLYRGQVLTGCLDPPIIPVTPFPWIDVLDLTSNTCHDMCSNEEVQGKPTTNLATTRITYCAANDVNLKKFPCSSSGENAKCLATFDKATCEKTYCISERRVRVNCQVPYLEPTVITPNAFGTLSGQTFAIKSPYPLKACTHDSSIYYQCINKEDKEGACMCFGNCLPLYGKPGQCLDVVYALEDTWAYLGIYAEHAPGNEGVHLPYNLEEGAPQDLILFKLTVTFGELDMLDILYNCNWEKLPSCDPEFNDVEYICDVFEKGNWKLQSIMPEFFNTQWQFGYQGTYKPYHLRYKKYRENKFLRKLSLEFSGLYTVVDALITKVRYKARENLNTVRLKSIHYQEMTAKTDANELLDFTVSRTTDAKWKTRDNVISSTDRLSLVRNPWDEVGNRTVMIHIYGENDAPVVVSPADGYRQPEGCKTYNEIPECMFGQFFAYEGSALAVPLPGVSVSDSDFHEMCPDDTKECVKMNVAVRAFKGTLGLNTRSGLEMYLDGRAGSGFTARQSDANNAIKVMFYAVELASLLGTPASTVRSFNTQTPGNVEFVSVTVSDQGFTSQDGIVRTTTIRIDIAIVAVNDGPILRIVKSGLTEFNPTEDVLGSLYGIQVLDIDLDEKVSSSLAQRNWMGKSSNTPYLNMMRMQISLSHGVFKFGYVRNLKLVQTDKAAYVTIFPFRFGHDVCSVEWIYNGAIISAIEAFRIASDNFKKLAGVYNERTAVLEVGITVYQSFCLFENIGGLDCPTGTELTCQCLLDPRIGGCASTSGSVVLHLNRSRAFGTFRDLAIKLIDEKDKTCGGMAFYPNPNNFTVGKKCSNDGDCQKSLEPMCEPGVTCACCANISFICTVHKDCDRFDGGSLCGCVRGGPSLEGTCGPYRTVLDGRTTTDLINPGRTQPELRGVPCRYAGEDSRSCKSAAYVANGTNLANIVDLVGLSSLGTSTGQIIGNIIEINRALDSLSYLSDSDYNRFYRPPLNQRDPFKFNIEADQLDSLVIEADDLGNSGGGQRDPRSTVITLPVRVAAVNDQPRAVGPARVKAYEDSPLHFENGPKHPLRAPRLEIVDPDAGDYGFADRIFSVNLSCSRGRLYLNEEFLTSTRKSTAYPFNPYQVGMASVDKSPSKKGVVFNVWEDRKELKGLTMATIDSEGVAIPKTDLMKFGGGCRFVIQCADGAQTDQSKAVSNDTSFGFFATTWYGVVYPLEGQKIGPGGNAHSCGMCVNTTGNQFISMDGTLEDINRALENVTYLPDPHFNTRYGEREYITFSVNDNGAQGNDANAAPLSHTHSIMVDVESVNDRPIIGRRIDRTRPVNRWKGEPAITVPDKMVLPINKTLDNKCMGFAPAGPDYNKFCNAKVREYIDVDEDTVFYISPSVLWIQDVDAEEAERMPRLRRYCCDEAGEDACICGRVCRCEGKVCTTCRSPEVCDGGAGELLVSLEVGMGYLSFVPPPGRNLFPQDQLTFVRNITSIDMTDGGFIEPCPDQKACMQNRSKLQFRTKISTLQKALDQLFLTYVPLPNRYGRDFLKVYVSDQGYTDDCYNSTLGSRETINIRVIGVNDDPVIKATDEVLLYAKGDKCYYDFQKYSIAKPNPGMNFDCNAGPNDTLVPTPSAGPSFSISDVDMDDTPFGNMTLYLTIGLDPEKQSMAGNFFLKETISSSTAWFEESRNNDGLLQMVIQATMAEINYLLKFLTYSADDDFQGYVPFKIEAFDMLNFGECSGKHKCGAMQPACMDVTEAENHTTPIQGRGRKIVDVAVGPPKTCVFSVALHGDAQKACQLCMGAPVDNGVGCGWCPSLCKSLGGKCMIANAGGGPRFETCPEGWNQCGEKNAGDMTVAAAVAVLCLVGVICAYTFLRWVQRRHGSVMVYGRRKRYDLVARLKVLNLLPPEDGSYFQVFVLIGCAAGLRIGLIILAELSNLEPLCDFQHEIFVDKSNAIEMSLDNCQVNFVPAPEQPPPEDSLKALKIKVALAKDPRIIMEHNACGTKATFAVLNKKPSNIRYSDYFCNIKIVVPLDGYVNPAIRLQAVGDNLTTVRSTSKYPGFSLVFGPNNFVLDGIRMVATLHGVQAKNFKYKVEHGRLTMIDLVVTEKGEFWSLSADMIVTSKLRSSVDFWQKQDNKVCLTAAKGSLYVDNNCEQVCRMRDTSGRLVDSPSSSRRSHALYAGLGANVTNLYNIEVIDPVAGKILENNQSAFVCTGNPIIDAQWTCLPYDAVQERLKESCPLGAAYAYRKDVPQIPGCTDLEFCMVTESSKCLCKPGCDMRGLSPPGTCNVGGQCCQNICEKFSYADMLPEENLPRCPQDPSIGTWCNGKLDQKMTFESETGQISYQVGLCSADSYGECKTVRDKPITRVHSYQGREPQEVVSTRVDMVEADKIILDELFHPGGNNRPRQEWFVFSLSGPGTPESSHGKFIWVSAVRHLILQPWFMEVVSYGLLSPEKIKASSRLSPGFCPAWVNYSKPEFLERIKVMYRVVFETIQRYPPNQKEKVLPVGTMVVFKPTKGPPIWFGVDVKSNLPILGYVKEEDNLLLMMLMYLGLGISGVGAAGIVWYLKAKWQAYMQDYRRTSLLQGQTMRNLSVLMAGKLVDSEEEVPQEDVKDMIDRTSFWYLFESAIGANDLQFTVLQQICLVLFEFTLALAPVAFPYLLNQRVEKSYMAGYHCEDSEDICKCRDEQPAVRTFTNTIQSLIDAYVVIVMLELVNHYLEISHNTFRRLLRHAFYLMLAIAIFFTMTAYVVVILFVIMGLIAKPAVAIPMIITVFGTIIVTVLLAIKILKFQTRVQRAVTHNVNSYRVKVANDVPKMLVDAIMGKRINEALNNNEINFPGLLKQIVIFILCLSAIFFFLYTGFTAFTDPSNFNVSLINDAILVTTIIAAYLIVVAEADANDMSDRISYTLIEYPLSLYSLSPCTMDSLFPLSVDQMSSEIMNVLHKTLDMVVAQFRTARKMMRAMENQMHDQIAEDDFDDSELSKGKM